MNIETFFNHWQIREHPFRAEEAKDDPVYLRLMHHAVSHPDLAKIFGDPSKPDTSVVFGEKGTGKTALKLLMEERYREHNRQHPDNQVYVVRHDDLNPAIDRVVRHLQLSDPADALSAFRLQDHIDAILIRAVTDLMDLILGEAECETLPRKRLRRLRRMEKRKRIDLLMLAMLYDHPPSGHTLERFRAISKFLKMGFFSPPKQFLLILILLGILSIGVAGGGFFFSPIVSVLHIVLPALAGLGAFLLAAWGWRKLRLLSLAKKVLMEVRVIERDRGVLSRLMGCFFRDDLTARPLPLKDEQDIRYQYVSRFVDILEEVGVNSMVVLVDRLDEPALVHGDASRIRSLVWPMLNNKFLQQDRTGFKMLLPIELRFLLIKEDPSFFQKARLDKQNLVERLEWSGATLYDVCSRRMQSCRPDDAEPLKLTDLFEEVTREHLVDALDQMHQPRDAFKFMYQVIQEHCRMTPEEEPEFKIPRLILNQVLREQSFRVQSFYRGLSPG